MPTELLLSNAALEMVSFLIVGIAAAWGMVKLLSVRHAGLFAVVYAGVPALVNAFGYGILSGEVGFILLLLSYIALPVALSEGGLALRIVVAVAALICVTATEAVEWALWGVVLAGPVPEGFEQYFDTVRRNVPVWMAVQLVRANLALCRLQGDVVQGESLGYLRTCGKFDLIFLDPPYDTGLLDKALENVVQFDILAEGGIIVCESRREKVLPQLRAPYHLLTERNYGKIKLTLYGKGIHA